MRVVAATAWTYWMALPILVMTASTLVVFICVYLKKVVEPRLLLEDQSRTGELPRAEGLAAVGAGRRSGARSSAGVGR